MFNVTKVEKEIGGKVISIETGKIANQAHGAVMVTCGETMVMATACVAPPRFADIDFFPLTVDYRERQVAAGKFPGGFMKREGRPSQREILIARCIDRPIRPLFPDGYFQEVQVMVNVMSADKENDPDVLAIIGASAALSISKIPFQGPLGAVKLGRVNGKYIINPTYQEWEDSDLNLLLGGRREAINMIEVASKEVSEDDMADAIEFAHKAIADVCDLIQELQDKCGVEKEIIVSELDEELLAQIRADIWDRVYEAKQIAVKQDRKSAVNAIFDEVKSEYCEGEEPRCDEAGMNRILGKIEKAVIRKLILDGKRPDGRDYDTLRDISCEVGILPRTHGSALFSRGETQALVSVILGTARNEQKVDGIVDEFGQGFMLHYNFPPYSVGEVRPVRGPGRREIGHGALAEKALEKIAPDNEDFAYTIKIVSDITGSNGSSSMASICGGCLAMMDAGVPIKAPVAGISVGMVSEGDRYELLTDILGEEDHFGDMDFKVAGSKKGITAIQLDIKAEGLPHAILRESLQRARDARFKILDIMGSVLEKPREELSDYAPKIVKTQINTDLIGKVIGPGGSTIKGIQEETGAVIEIAEDGVVTISVVEGNGHIRAMEIVDSIAKPPKVGTVYSNAKVQSVKDFGVFVEIIPGVEGLCHISELSNDYVKNAEDVCKVGDIISVKLIAIDDLGRLKLSRKAVLVEQSEDQQ